MGENVKRILSDNDMKIEEFDKSIVKEIIFISNDL